jgi:DNA-binding response OmpR family regulator
MMFVPASATHSPKILAVDDDPAIRRLIERALRSEGYEVQTVPSAEAAMSALQRKTDFALVLVDVMMTGQNGIDLVRRIREGEAGSKHATMPVVFVTAEDDAKTYEASFELDALRFVTKPFTADELVNVISSVLHEPHA